MSYIGFDLEKGLKRAAFCVKLKRKSQFLKKYFRIDFFSFYDGFWNEIDQGFGFFLWEMLISNIKLVYGMCARVLF